MFTCQVNGQVTFNISPSTINGDQGDIVCASVTVDNFTSMISAQFSINYDPNILSFVEFQNLNLSGLSNSNLGNPDPGDIAMSWITEDFANGETISDGTAIFDICFEIIAASGSTELTFSSSPTLIEVTNINGEVTPVFNGGTVVAGNGGGSGGTPDPVSFAAPSLSVNNGANICVPITVMDFDSIVSFQYSINFDETILAYTGAQGFNVPGMNASNVANPSNGNITVSWLAGDVTVGESIADGTVAFEICFDGIGNDETSDLIFSGTPSVIEVTTPSGEITPTFTNGAVTVNSVGGPTAVTFSNHGNRFYRYRIISILH